jgi:pyridoxine 4-dehydrogenase
MHREGLIRHAGLSQVSVEEIEAAQRILPGRHGAEPLQPDRPPSEAVLDYCTAKGIGFIPWYPLASGDLAKPGRRSTTLARETGATPGQIALAWMLKRSPVMLPIPGTSQVKHLERQRQAAAITAVGRGLHRPRPAGPRGGLARLL